MGAINNWLHQDYGRVVPLLSAADGHGHVDWYGQPEVLLVSGPQRGAGSAEARGRRCRALAADNRRVHPVSDSVGVREGGRAGVGFTPVLCDMV